MYFQIVAETIDYLIHEDLNANFGICACLGLKEIEQLLIFINVSVIIMRFSLNYFF